MSALLTEVSGIMASGLGNKSHRLSILTEHEGKRIKQSTHITFHCALTFPAPSAVPACAGDTAYNKLLGPPQTRAGSASDSPANKNQNEKFT